MEGLNRQRLHLTVVDYFFEFREVLWVVEAYSTAMSEAVSLVLDATVHTSNFWFFFLHRPCATHGTTVSTFNIEQSFRVQRNRLEMEILKQFQSFVMQRLMQQRNR